MSRPGEEQLAALADQLGLGLLVTSAGQIVNANRQFCDLLRHSIDELMAMPSAITLFSPEDRSLLAELYSQGVNGPTTAQHEHSLIDRDGGAVPVSIAFSLSPGPDDSVNAIALIRDLRVDRARAAERGRFSDLVDRLPVGVLVWDGSGVNDPVDLRLDFANEAALAALDRKRGVLIGGTLSQVFPAADPGDAARLLALCGTERMEHLGEVSYPDERAHPTLYRWQAVGLPGGMVAAVFEDISTERAGEARRRDLLHRLLDTSDAERRRLAMDLHDDAVGGVRSLV